MCEIILARALSLSALDIVLFNVGRQFILSLMPLTHNTNGSVAFLERWKELSPLVTVHQTLATVKETPYTLGHRLWSILPLWKFWAAQNIASGEIGSIVRSGKVYRRYNNAKAKFLHRWTQVRGRWGPKDHRWNLERWTTAIWSTGDLTLHKL